MFSFSATMRSRWGEGEKGQRLIFVQGLEFGDAEHVNIEGEDRPPDIFKAKTSQPGTRQSGGVEFNDLSRDRLVRRSEMNAGFHHDEALRRQINSQTFVELEI